MGDQQQFWFFRLLQFSRTKLHFSAALGDTGATKIFTPRLWHVVFICALAVMMSFFGGVAFLSGADVSENYALKQQLVEARNQLSETRNELTTVEEELGFKNQKVKVFAQELGRIQARLEYFERVGEKLYENEYFGQYLSEIDNIAPAGSADTRLSQDPVSVFAMATQLSSAKRRANKIANFLETTADLMSQTQLNKNVKPHHWPVVHERSYVSSHYGWRENPIDGGRHWHAGFDIAAPHNAPVVSSGDGVVTFAGYRFGYGIMVEITHGGGMITRYAHLNRAMVHNNQNVNSGELIGLIGSTGRSTGPHLHFELLAGGHKVDPYPFIKGGRQNAKMLAQSDAEATDPSRF
mgnify:CR=1 FL=1